MLLNAEETLQQLSQDTDASREVLQSVSNASALVGVEWQDAGPAIADIIAVTQDRTGPHATENAVGALALMQAVGDLPKSGEDTITNDDVREAITTMASNYIDTFGRTPIDGDSYVTTTQGTSTISITGQDMRDFLEIVNSNQEESVALQTFVQSYTQAAVQNGLQNAPDSMQIIYEQTGTIAGNVLRGRQDALGWEAADAQARAEIQAQLQAERYAANVGMLDMGVGALQTGIGFVPGAGSLLSFGTGLVYQDLRPDAPTPDIPEIPEEDLRELREQQERDIQMGTARAVLAVADGGHNIQGYVDPPPGVRDALDNGTYTQEVQYWLDQLRTNGVPVNYPENAEAFNDKVEKN
ncbi:MAG: hypothetical protein GEU93_09265 [Propionibacteriales bacterium]|nr:hypothetical protein [Propionibacteriales bacterium]